MERNLSMKIPNFRAYISICNFIKTEVSHAFENIGRWLGFQKTL